MSHTNAEFEHLDSLLHSWGDWQEKHSEDAVLPHQAAFSMIWSDQPPGSRILCAEMSSRVYEVNLAIHMLRLQCRQALFIWYAIQLKERGGYWSVNEKAELFDCTANALRLRVARARQELLPKYYQVLETKALQKRKSHDTSLRA